MKKILALLLAAMMVLACLPVPAEEAAAGTLLDASAPSAPHVTDIQLSVDRDVAKSVMAHYGMPEEQIGVMEPLLAVLSALGVRVTEADGGLQIDLDLNGTNVLSLGGMETEDGLTIGSTLFPNHLITVSGETVTELIRKHFPPEGGADLTNVTAAVAVHAQKYTDAIAASIVPGTPEPAEFDVGGCEFDLLTPIRVDAGAIAGAVKGLITELLKDETVLGTLQGKPDFNPEDTLKKMDELLSEERIPDVTAELYTGSDGGPAFYFVSEATRKGEEDPAFRLTALNPEDGTAEIRLQAFESGASIGLSYDPNGLYADYITEEEYFALKAEVADDGRASLELYVTETETPLLSLTFTESAEGERTLSLDPEGKTVVRAEDLTGEQPAEASATLLQDIMANLGPLMTNAAEAVPEFAGLMTLLGSQTAEQ